MAIVKLSKPVSLSSKVGVVSLLTEKLSELSGALGSVYGWDGKTPWQISQPLKRARMEILSNLVCQFFHSQKNETITRNHVCALRDENEISPCHDDTGSKLIVKL